MICVSNILSTHKTGILFFKDLHFSHQHMLF